MTPRREMVSALALVAAGATLALLASAVTSGGTGTGGVAATADPSAGSGAPAALALAALAGGGALLLAGPWGRVLLGLALLGVAGELLAIGVSEPVSAESAVSAVAGVAVLAGAVLIVVRGRSWPAPRGRYQAQAGDGTPPAGAPARTARSTWDAQDRGEDPTAG